MAVKGQVLHAKLSGERLAASAGDCDLAYGINEAALEAVAADIITAHNDHPDHGFVFGLGGGNFWRGRNSSKVSGRVTHFVGRVSTAFNALFLGDALDRAGVASELLLAPTMRLEDELAEPGFKPFSPEAVHEAVQANKVVLLGGGLGIPGETSDSGTARAAGMYDAYRQSIEDGVQGEASRLVKLTQFDGVYTADPRLVVEGSLSPDGVRRYHTIAAEHMLAQGLQAVDEQSLGHLRHYGLSMHVVGESRPLTEVVALSVHEAVQAGIGTLITPHLVGASYHDSLALGL